MVIAMDITISLAIITIIGTFSGIAGYILMRAKYQKELKEGIRREQELSSRVYETAVLKEIGERIGYSLDATKIIEIISGSLGQLLAYSTVSYIILSEKDDKLPFVCDVRESVSRAFIEDVKRKMLAALSEMLQEAKLDVDVDERISGAILDEQESAPVRSFFNLPIVISEELAGIINVASKDAGLYGGSDTLVLYRIAQQASFAVSRLQDVLASEKGKLVQSVESLSDGVLMVDTGYQLILANKKLRELLSTIERPKILDIVSALSGTFDLRAKMEEAISVDEPLPGFEIVLRDKVLSVYVSCVRDQKSGKPLGVVVMLHDITDAKSLERLRQEFMAMMVHELRAPLTSIKSTVEMVKSSDLSKIGTRDLAKYLATIDSTSATMLELVNDLLDVAKVEAGKFDVICAEGDISEVIVERVESIKAQALSKNLELIVDIEKNLPVAWFDKVRIKQVLNNLLSNAVKYTDSGEIRVKAAVANAGGVPIDILVSVADTGIGIESSQTERLFSKFGQLEDGRNKAGLKSSGLGLYITKKIVEASGGKIWVESAGADSGSTFYFTVPLGKSLQEPKDEGGALKSFTTQKVARA